MGVTGIGGLFFRAQLEADGIEVVTNPEWDAPGVGRFARMGDPDGNQIELREPD